ncbi:MAG: serine hydrolase domain-containing protein [Cyclobacteriaceae bacterium]
MYRVSILLALVFTISCDFQDDATIPKSPWEYALPSEVGVDEGHLNVINNRIKDGVYGQLTSLIIIKDDKLIFENYYNNANRHSRLPMLGTTVSISSILTGIALDEGIILDLDSLIINKLPDHFTTGLPQVDSTLKTQITYRNLLEMKMGVSWNELLRQFNDPQNTANQMSQTQSWSFFTMRRAMDSTPGGRFTYNSGSYMLLSLLIQEQSGFENLAAYAQQRLFEPLGIDYNWNSDPSGVTNAGWGLEITPTSLAKIGYMSLNQGSYFGNQILSPDFANAMGAKQTEYTFNWDYGFGWWRISDFSAFAPLTTQNDIYFSWGSGGQFLFVIPHLNMVVVTTANNFAPNFNETLGINLVLTEIVPSAESFDF